MSKKEATTTQISQNIKDAQKELETLKEKYGVELAVTPQFPMYNILPDKLQLALRIFYKENPQFLISLVEKPQEDESAQ